MLMLCLVFAVAGPVMPGAGDVSPMDPTMAYGAAPNMLVFAPDGGAGFDLEGQTRANGGGALPTRRTVPGRAAAGRHCLARVRPGEEHLHATDGGGVSNASAIGVRGLCNRSACRMRCPPACDSSSSRGT